MAGSKFNPGGTGPAIPRVDKPENAADGAIDDALGAADADGLGTRSRVTMFGRRMNMYTWTPTEDVWSAITRSNY